MCVCVCEREERERERERERENGDGGKYIKTSEIDSVPCHQFTIRKICSPLVLNVVSLEAKGFNYRTFAYN